MELIEHFHEHGWTRVPQAFCSETAAAMREAVWHLLADRGIHRDEPSTWTIVRPAHLQRLKDHPVFRAAGSRSVLAAIDTILAGQVYATPKNWGALFIAFPSKDKWGMLSMEGGSISPMDVSSVADGMDRAAPLTIRRLRSWEWRSRSDHSWRFYVTHQTICPAMTSGFFQTGMQPASMRFCKRFRAGSRQKRSHY
jgi:hypothetical protein